MNSPPLSTRTINQECVCSPEPVQTSPLKHPCTSNLYNENSDTEPTATSRQGNSSYCTIRSPSRGNLNPLQVLSPDSSQTTNAAASSVPTKKAPGLSIYSFIRKPDSPPSEKAGHAINKTQSKNELPTSNPTAAVDNCTDVEKGPQTVPSSCRRISFSRATDNVPEECQKCDSNEFKSMNNLTSEASSCADHSSPARLRPLLDESDCISLPKNPFHVNIALVCFETAKNAGFPILYSVSQIVQLVSFFLLLFCLVFSFELVRSQVKLGSIFSMLRIRDYCVARGVHAQCILTTVLSTLQATNPASQVFGISTSEKNPLFSVATPQSIIVSNITYPAFAVNSFSLTPTYDIYGDSFFAWLVTPTTTLLGLVKYGFLVLLFIHFLSTVVMAYCSYVYFVSVHLYLANGDFPNDLRQVADRIRSMKWTLRRSKCGILWFDDISLTSKSPEIFDDINSLNSHQGNKEKTETFLQREDASLVRQLQLFYYLQVVHACIFSILVFILFHDPLVIIFPISIICLLMSVIVLSGASRAFAVPYVTGKIQLRQLGILKSLCASISKRLNNPTLLLSTPFDLNASPLLGKTYDVVDTPFSPDASITFKLSPEMASKAALMKMPNVSPFEISKLLVYNNRPLFEYALPLGHRSCVLRPEVLSMYHDSLPDKQIFRVLRTLFNLCAVIIMLAILQFTSREEMLHLFRIRKALVYLCGLSCIGKFVELIFFLVRYIKVGHFVNLNANDFMDSSKLTVLQSSVNESLMPESPTASPVLHILSDNNEVVDFLSKLEESYKVNLDAGRWLRLKEFFGYTSRMQYLYLEDAWHAIGTLVIYAVLVFSACSGQECQLYDLDCIASSNSSASNMIPLPSMFLVIIIHLHSILIAFFLGYPRTFNDNLSINIFKLLFRWKMPQKNVDEERTIDGLKVVTYLK